MPTPRLWLCTRPSTPVYVGGIAFAFLFTAYNTAQMRSDSEGFLGVSAPLTAETQGQCVFATSLSRRGIVPALQLLRGR